MPPKKKQEDATPIPSKRNIVTRSGTKEELVLKKEETMIKARNKKREEQIAAKRKPKYKEAEEVEMQVEEPA
jgi:hypothetical protein